MFKVTIRQHAVARELYKITYTKTCVLTVHEERGNYEKATSNSFKPFTLIRALHEYELPMNCMRMSSFCGVLLFYPTRI